MLEKEVRILYARHYDFINEKTGEHIVGVTCSYCFTEQVDKEFEKGFKVLKGTFPTNKFALITSKLPYECTGLFEVNNSQELKLVDVKVK